MMAEVSKAAATSLLRSVIKNLSSLLDIALPPASLAERRPWSNPFRRAAFWTRAQPVIVSGTRLLRAATGGADDRIRASSCRPHARPAGRPEAEGRGAGQTAGTDARRE